MPQSAKERDGPSWVPPEMSRTRVAGIPVLSWTRDRTSSTRWLEVTDNARTLDPVDPGTATNICRGEDDEGDGGGVPAASLRRVGIGQGHDPSRVKGKAAAFGVKGPRTARGR